MAGRFQDKVALVTGAGTGIGRATAIAFAAEGASVAVAGNHAENLDETVTEIEKNGGTAAPFVVDVSRELEVDVMVQHVLDTFEGLHVAFNNAGIEGTPAPTHECPTETWERTIGVNLTGTFLCLRAEVRHMLENGGGAIVNCSSIAGLRGFEGIPAYSASKHGVIGLTRTTALETAKKGIRVNAVCPGPIRTPMLERFTQGDMSTFEAQVPDGRVGDPEEVAAAVLWLCDDGASNYVTGHALPVDGGWTAR